MSKVVRLAIVAGVALSLSACATVTRGTSEKFYVLSDPDGASVSLSTGETCTTPCTIKLKRKNEFDVTVSMAGYKSKTVHVDSKVKGGGVAGGAGNLLLGGVIGGIVDGSNGAMKNLDPNPLKVHMAAEGSAEESMVVEAEKPKKPKK